MNTTLLDQLVNAVLYEGYVLYPYRPTSKKNQRERFTFGRVYPLAYSAAQNGLEPCVTQIECLMRCPGERATVKVTARFLHPMWREVGKLPAPLFEIAAGSEPRFEVVSDLWVDGQLHQTWQEAVEQKVQAPAVSVRAGSAELVRFSFPASRTLTPVRDSSGQVGAVIVRRQDAIAGVLEVEVNQVAASIFKVSVRIRNLSQLTAGELQSSDAVLMRTFTSTHLILQTPEAEFISLLEPQAEYEPLVATCKNIGAWPVLVGDATRAERDTMLASPIILYDYPKIAPESGGDFCDSTEIDEMLALRVLTMTDEEKREMRGVDGFARRMLERTEALSQEKFMKMHGTLRDVHAAEEFFNPSKPAGSVVVKGVKLKAGDRVRIRPKNRADAIDMILAGKLAIVEAVEEDAEDRIHLAVVLEDDPGRDLGLSRQPGHRFFYSSEEVEPLEEAVL
jgi:hypothetical protein